MLMKRIVILLLLICLAKLAGAQSPKRISYQVLLTTPAGSIANDVTRTTDGVNLAAPGSCRRRTRP